MTTWWREFRFQMPDSSEIPGGKCWDKEESWLPKSLLSFVPSSVQKLSEIICHQHLVERTSSPCCPGVMDGLSQLVETNPAQHGVFKWFGLAWRSTVLKVKWNMLFLVSRQELTVTSWLFMCPLQHDLLRINMPCITPGQWQHEKHPPPSFCADACRQVNGDRETLCSFSLF